MPAFDAFTSVGQKLYLSNADMLSTNDWKKLLHAFRNIGYDIPRRNDVAASRYKAWSQNAVARGLPGHELLPDQATAARELFQPKPGPDENAARELETAAIAHYGTTRDPGLAGYITISGKLLNFSREGRQRDIEHMDVNVLFEDNPGSATGADRKNAAYMREFIAMGNIRIGHCFLDIAAPPTERQYATLGRVIQRWPMDDIYLELSSDGSKPCSETIPACYHMSRTVIKTIHEYFPA